MWAKLLPPQTLLIVGAIGLYLCVWWTMRYCGRSSGTFSAGRVKNCCNAPVSSKHTEGRTQSTANEGGFAVIQALGPVYMGSPRGTGWFSALEVSMNQGTSLQNCPSINPALTWMAEPRPAVWAGDVRCSHTTSVPNHSETSFQESENVMGENFLGEYLYYIQRHTEALLRYPVSSLHLFWDSTGTAWCTIIKTR